MPNVTANGIQIEYDTFGDNSSPALLLIMGGGSQMIYWEVEFCEVLAKKGHFVIRFDNRDVGLSTKFEKAGVPDMMAAMKGEPVIPATPLRIWQMMLLVCLVLWALRRHISVVLQWAA